MIWIKIKKLFQVLASPSHLTAFLFFLLSPSHPLFSKDFGIQGELFPIAEQNLIIVLQQKMNQRLSEEDFSSFFSPIKEKAKHPRSPLVPPNATARKTHYYDPTLILSQPITDKTGAILFPKGTKVNPLEHIQLINGLLFLDGSNPSHLEWARSQKDSFKWILVSGNPFELEEQENRPVYFDQQGLSVEKFQIGHIPALVTQDGLLLKIEEIPSQELEAAP